MKRLEGKTAIVTGGARGMGAATCRLFIEHGARVVIGDLADEAGESLAAELGGDCRYVHMDVSSSADWKKAIEAASELGPINVLVNNAAILIHATIADTSEEDYMRVVSINQLGVFLGMKAVLPAMKASGGGSIVNISSIDGLQSKNSLIAYSSTKWAVRGLTKAAALEMGKFGIRVNSVHPGGIYTRMHGSDYLSEEQASEFYQHHALPRVGKPEEVARMSLFLASDEASYSTGSEFSADGGWHAGLVDDMLPQL